MFALSKTLINVNKNFTLQVNFISNTKKIIKNLK